jgi:hypothetical protein
MEIFEEFEGHGENKVQAGNIVKVKVLGYHAQSKTEFVENNDSDLRERYVVLSNGER